MIDTYPSEMNCFINFFLHKGVGKIRTQKCIVEEDNGNVILETFILVIF